MVTYLYLQFLKTMALCSCSDISCVSRQVPPNKLSLNILIEKQEEQQIVVYGGGRKKKYLGKYIAVKDKSKG